MYGSLRLAGYINNNYQQKRKSSSSLATDLKSQQSNKHGTAITVYIRFKLIVTHSGVKFRVKKVRTKLSEISGVRSWEPRKKRKV